MDLVDLLRAFQGRPSSDALQSIAQAFPTPIPSSTLAPTPGPDPYRYIRNPQTGELVRAGLPNIDPRMGQISESLLQPADILGGMAAHAATPAGRAILGSEVGSVGRRTLIPEVLGDEMEIGGQFYRVEKMGVTHPKYGQTIYLTKGQRPYELNIDPSGERELLQIEYTPGGKAVSQSMGKFQGPVPPWAASEAGRTEVEAETPLPKLEYRK